MSIGHYLYAIQSPLLKGVFGMPEREKDAEALAPSEINPAAVRTLEELLELSYHSGEFSEGNVCMANAEEVRPDFRTGFTSSELLNYIFAVVHSNSYIQAHPELPKAGPIGVACPINADNFWELVQLGKELKALHSRKSFGEEELSIKFVGEGDNRVGIKITESGSGYTAAGETTGKIWINGQQYFDQVPLLAWEYKIYGSFPAQEWLQKQAGRELSPREIRDFRGLLHLLGEMSRLQAKIDTIGVGKEKEIYL